MELICVRETMKIAQREKVCSFFDPMCPQRGVEPLLDDFSHSMDQPYLRIGVDYTAWLKPEDRPPLAPSKTGTIYFIRMRLLRPGRPVGSSRITKDEVFNCEQLSKPGATKS